MGLIIFHRLLIGTAIVFFLGFGVWSLFEYRASGGAGLLVLGAASLIVTAAFGYYLKNLRRFLRL